MGLMQEGLRKSGEIGNALAPVNLNRLEINNNGLAKAEAGLDLRIRELSRMLSFEEKEGKEKQYLQPQEANNNGFEPFVDPETQENQLFINGYNGNFTQKMELNRKGVERVLKIAHLEGQVVLTSLSFSRQRSIGGVNPDGSVAAKKKLMPGEEIDDSQKEINPPYRTVPTRDGWKIEINDGKILDDLNEKKLTGEKLQTTFIKNFNQLLNKSLFECILKEKMTGIKDNHFRRKVLIAVLNPGLTLSLWASGIFHLDTFLAEWFVVSALSNLVGLLGKRRAEGLGTISSAYIGRKLDAPWEYLMPMIEVDKVAKAWTFLSLKGRTLVKESSRSRNLEG